MIHRFRDFELDTVKRELRGTDGVVHLQPQAFAVLEYLVEHRGRAVTKAELLEKLWPDATVGTGSLQRAVHLVRAAIDDDSTCIRTVPRHGYRFVATVESVASVSTVPISPQLSFRPRFAMSGEVHIAYHTVGEGDLDLVLVAGWSFPMRSYFDHPVLREVIERFASYGRVIVFDKRGTGMSDRVKGVPSLEERMDDLRAVLDAVASREAVLVGFSEGGPLCLLHAATYPRRTRGILLVSSFARWAAAPDYPAGWSQEAVDRLRRYIRGGWGAGETIRAVTQSRAADPEFSDWAATAEQEGASPGAALALLEMNLLIDVRPLLISVSTPAAILHHRGDTVIGVENSRYLAAHIPGARYLEVEGRDHVFFFENREKLWDALDWLVATRGNAGARYLTTILTVDSRASSPAAAEGLVQRYHGVSTGAPWVWSFDGPQRAIRCAHELLSRWGEGERKPGVGIHTGEVVRRGVHIAGGTLAVAAAIAASARSGEVRVSRVVRDLVHGSPLAFSPCGEVELADGTAIATMASQG